MRIKIKAADKGFDFSVYNIHQELETSKRYSVMIAGVELKQRIETFQKVLVIEIENVGTIVLSNPTKEAGHTVSVNVEVQKKNDETFSCESCQVGTLINALELYINRAPNENFLDLFTRSPCFEHN